MAKATKCEIQLPAPPYTVTLELNQDEAETLHQILRNIGGDAFNPPRRNVRSIERALNEAGVRYTKHPYESWAKEIYFADPLPERCNAK